ncbi:MAG TPA: hypothetical protein VMM93_01685 [Vicinamibacterales bacterium]|nr:hypothetical protein [Vicinamibacterales bacterium]
MHQTAPASEVELLYRQRLADRRTVLAARQHAHLQLSRARLALVALFFAIPLVVGFAQAAWSAVPAALFGIVAIVHARRLDDRRKAASAVAFYERGLARLSHGWIGQGDQGQRFASDAHSYAGDLDVFGRGGLFELVATARTEAGQQTLARWLLEPAAPDLVTARQAAVRELAPRVDLRERMAVLGDELRVGVDADGLRAWAVSPVRMPGGWIRVALLAVPLVWIGHVTWMLTTWSMTLADLRAIIAILALQAGVAWAFRSRVVPVIHAVDEPTRDLSLLGEVLAVLEREEFDSAELIQLQRALLEPRRASAEVARLETLSALLASRRNLFFTLAAALLLWATQLAGAIEAWRRRAGTHVSDWLDAVGELEALLSLAAFAYEHPDYTFPEFQAEATGIRAQALAHPLLDREAVPNDLELGGSGPALFIVSGSNMSGKSTWLRAIGVNVVLAQAGAPVRAAAMALGPLHVGAAMRVADSLVDGRSHFMAEITRLKQIVDLARAHGGRVLFLLDEVLAGTNSHDRRHGAEGLLSGLVGLGAIGLVTTHDLALGELATTLAPVAENVHFEDAFDGAQLAFDYHLRPGVVRTSNAIALMRSIGLDV